jgi:hypothetical protein
VLYNGGQFDVTLVGSGGSAGAWTYDFMYTADLSGWIDGTNDEYIGAINFGIGGTNPTVVPELQSTNAGGVGDWQVFLANATAGGCTGGNNFEACVQVLQTSLDIAPTDSFDGTYEWIVRMTYANKLTVAGVSDPDNPIRAWLLQTCQPGQGNCPESGFRNAGLMSLNTPFNTDGGGGLDGGTQDGGTQTPEPATLALFGLALAVGASQIRRRNRK